MKVKNIHEFLSASIVEQGKSLSLTLNLPVAVSSKEGSSSDVEEVSIDIDIESLQEQLLRKIKTSKLEHVTLYGVYPDRPIDGQAVVDVLSDLPTLKTLIFEESNLGDDFGVRVLMSLKNNNTLEMLSCMYCEINKNGAKAIAKFLKKNKSLKSLMLGSNDLHDKGVLEIAEAIEENSSLETLLVPFNGISNVGAEVLARVIKDNKALKKLALEGNKIGNFGGSSIAEMVKVNSGLLEISLYDNQIDGSILKFFLQALTQNLTLTKFVYSVRNLKELSPRKISAQNNKFEQSFLQYKEVAEDLEKALARNLSIQELILLVDNYWLEVFRESSVLNKGFDLLASCFPNVNDDEVVVNGNPIAEYYRLLNGALYITQLNVESIERAAELLSKPFAIPSLQAAVDTSWEFVLYNSSALDNVESEIRAKYYRAMLWPYRHRLIDTDLPLYIKSCLYGLRNPAMNPNKDLDKLSMRELTGVDGLIPYDQLRSLAEAASDSCLPSESQAIKQFLQLQNQLSIAAKNLLDCPSVWVKIKLKYPTLQKIQILEDFLFSTTINGEEVDVAPPLQKSVSSLITASSSSPLNSKKRAADSVGLEDEQSDVKRPRKDTSQKRF